MRCFRLCGKVTKKKDSLQTFLAELLLYKEKTASSLKKRLLQQLFTGKKEGLPCGSPLVGL